MNLRIEPRQTEGIDSIRSGAVRFVMDWDAVDGCSPRRTARCFVILNRVQQDDRNPDHGAGSAATC